MSEERRPWDQLEGESDAAYARFLIYRNLGPARSLNVAYLAANPKAIKGNKRQGSAPGQWTRDSVQFNWPERASAWDVEILTETGRETVVGFIHALRLISTKALAALMKDSARPRSWKGALEAVILLGNFIPAETVQRLQADARERRISAIGGRGGDPADGKPPETT